MIKEFYDNGITVPSEFSQIVKEWPLSQALKELRSFLGKCNCYHSHFQNFAIIESPLMVHLKGGSESPCKLMLEDNTKGLASFIAPKKL